MSNSTLPADGPLIIRTLEKPFFPGRRVFALYEDHVVIATVRGHPPFPKRINAGRKSDDWETLPGTRRVSVLRLADVARIRSYEKGNGPDSTVRLTFVCDDATHSVLLPEAMGTLALAHLAENCEDKLDPEVESVVELRRSSGWSLVVVCLLLDGWVAFILWELATRGSITGPRFLVDIVRRVYESRGFGATALVCGLGAVFFNLLMWVLSFATPPTKARLLNCAHCGYRLRGLKSEKCPECGEPIKTSLPTRR